MRKKILVVEDDKIQVDLIQAVLFEDHEVHCAYTIGEAENKLHESTYDMFIVDLGLPDGSGLSFCTRIRNEKKFEAIPIFIISANSDVYTKISSLELGADDYITKPIHPMEFKTKIKNKFKRLEAESGTTNLFRIDKFHIDYEKRRLLIEDVDNQVKEVELTNKEFDLFALLAKNEGRVFSRQELIDRIWFKNMSITDRVIDTHMASIRKKIKPYGHLITSEYGIGYKFKVPLDKTTRKQ